MTLCLQSERSYRRAEEEEEEEVEEVEEEEEENEEEEEQEEKEENRVLVPNKPPTTANGRHTQNCASDSRL